MTQERFSKSDEFFVFDVVLVRGNSARARKWLVLIQCECVPLLIDTTTTHCTRLGEEPSPETLFLLLANKAYCTYKTSLGCDKSEDV